MQINKLISIVQELHPCVFSNEMMLHWLSELDGQINAQVHLLTPMDLKPYEMTDNGGLPEVQLLVPYPYDSLYVQYLLSQLHYYEGEYDKYQNTMQMYNLRYTEYVKWVCENLAPATGEAERLQYYLSAYALAVKHGYGGSEEEWLRSLKGDKGEKGDKGDKGEPGSGIHYVQVFLSPDDYINRIANVQQDGVYKIESSDYIAENTGDDDWVDRPTDESNEEFVLIVSQYDELKNVQIAISGSNGKIYTRTVMRYIGSDGNYSVHRDWESLVTENDIAPLRIGKGIKQPVILAIGDSICAGGSNDGRGFVGELGFPYVNKGVNGAMFTKTVESMADNQIIGNQLEEAFSEGISADIVIVEGGANDYKFAADLEKTLAAVEEIFGELYQKYPLARKFFLMIHRTYSEAMTMNQFEGCNWTVTENCSGYTLRELFVRIYSLCQSYGIEVIDVHSNSELNTNDKKFVSTVNKADYEGREAEYYRLTATDWVASDGLHPLAYGYSHGYLPIVREAIFGN